MGSAGLNTGHGRGPTPPKLEGKIGNGLPSEKVGRRARGSALGAQLRNAGNNALKDQRSVTKAVLEERLAGRQRSSRRTTSERRDANLSEIAALNYSGTEGNTLSSKIDQ